MDFNTSSNDIFPTWSIIFSNCVFCFNVPDNIISTCWSLPTKTESTVKTLPISPAITNVLEGVRGGILPLAPPAGLLQFFFVYCLPTLSQATGLMHCLLSNRNHRMMTLRHPLPSALYITSIVIIAACSRYNFRHTQCSYYSISAE